MLFAQAYAQTAPAPSDGGGGMFGGGMAAQLLPIVLIIVVFYFLLIRPQQKKAKDHKAMISNLRRGDRVVTSGGIVGQVTKVLSDTEVQLEISEGVRVRAYRSAISDVLQKTGPADGPSASDDEDDEKGGKERDQKAVSGKGR